MEEERVVGSGGVEEEVAMRIHLVEAPAEPWQITEMLEAHGTFIKVAVDLERETLAGGGEWHADCERVLLEDGSRQQDIWGGDWDPHHRLVRYGSLINIRPSQENLQTELLDPALRLRFRAIIERLLAAR